LGEVKRLAGQVILVTGSTMGLGRAMVETFAEEGARVVITGRSQDKGRAIEAKIGAAGGEALYVPMDVSDEAQVEAAVRAAVERFGKLTGLVNNAAWIQGRGDRDGPLTEIESDDWRKILDINLNGVYYASKHALRAIARAGGGAVVNISSMAGIRGQVTSHGYVASKGAIQALTRSMAVYYSRYNIRVNCIVVGTIDTGEGLLADLLADPQSGPQLRQTYLGRVGKPVEVAKAAAHLLSSEAAFTNGVLLPVDNGASIRNAAARKVVDMKDVPPPTNRWV
jgi:NAD(P)-dependent dehydrogenase (short-subunit alcohol dehydrogenase family)